MVICVDSAKLMSNLDQNKKRCEWCLKDELYMSYHDNEWGIPSHDDQHLFEHLILETFQSGLSWYTILVKRENFRAAFHQFDPHQMANMGESEVEELMHEEGIIRNRAKINAAINNARCYLKIREEFGSFDKYIWQFTSGEILNFTVDSWSDVKKTIPQSDAMAKDLKKKGFKFVGSTTCMAYMEAVGMVNNHFSYCWKSHQ